MASLAAASALVLTACGGESDADTADSAAADTITVTDSRGTEEVPLNPQSVVVFDMGVLDTLDALGVEAVSGVPQANVPSYLSTYESDEYVDVGTLFEPDLEAIPTAEPDLIIVGGRSSETHDTLSDTFEGVPVLDVNTDETDYVGSAAENITMLASIFEKESEAKDALAELDERIAEVKASTDGAGTGLVLLTSAGEVTAYGINSRFSLVHDVFGVEPATEQLGDSESRHGESVSFEFIREANPDHLLVVDRDAAIGESGETAEEILDNELVASTTAWSEGNVTYLDPEAWYIVVGGLTSLGTMVTDLEEAFA